MLYNRKYNFVISLPFLVLMLVFMSVTAWDMPVGNFQRWIPILAGFVDIEDIPLLQSHLLSTLCLFLSSLSLYAFNERFIMAGRISLILPLVYLILAFSSSHSMIFSGTSVASLIVIWSFYSSMNVKKEDQSIFVSVFLATSAALFEPLALYLVPVAIFFSMRDVTVSMRTIVLTLLAVLIPFVFICSLRFIFFDDALIFAEEYFSHLRVEFILEPNVKSVSNIMYIIALIALILASVKDIFRRINSFKIVKSASFVRFITMIFFLAGTILLYPGSGSWVMQIIAIPAAVLIVESTGEHENSHKKRLGLLIVTIFMIVSRIACFI